MNTKDYGEHVFIVGSSRSGTTLVHSILMSCPLYAVYRAETQLLNGCDLKYGELSRKKSRESFLHDWFRSRQFIRSGINKEEFLDLLFKDNKPTYIYLLSRFMNLVSAKQNRDRWIDSTPGNIFSLSQISEHFPNAKVIHVIRDGRAVALSRTKLGWNGVGTQNFDRALGFSALMWERSIHAGHDINTILPGRNIEVKYEDLVENPDDLVNRLAHFLGVSNLSINHINERAKSSVNNNILSTEYSNNSAFADLSEGISKAAAYRWKDALNVSQISRIETFVGDTLKNLDYPILTGNQPNIKYLIDKLYCKAIINSKNLIKNIPAFRPALSSPLEIDVD